VFGIAAASRNTRFQAARYGLTWAGLPPADRASFGWRLRRGRDASCLAPPAQFRTCDFPAYGSHLGYKRQSNLAPTCRMRSSACDTLTRRCVRRVLCQSAFPLAPALGSTDSAAAGSFTDGSVAERAALFAGFLATMTGRDFPCPYIIGYDSSSSRCGPSRSRNI
jgi:hypothetical protein